MFILLVLIFNQFLNFMDITQFIYFLVNECFDILICLTLDFHLQTIYKEHPFRDVRVSHFYLKVQLTKWKGMCIFYFVRWCFLMYLCQFIPLAIGKRISVSLHLYHIAPAIMIASSFNCIPQLLEKLNIFSFIYWFIWFPLS